MISIIFTSVINLGRFETFEGCTTLTSVTVANPNNPFITSENGVVFNKAKTRLYFCPQGWQGHYSIPHSVTEICDGAFDDCPAVFSVHPDNPVFESKDGKIDDKILNSL